MSRLWAGFPITRRQHILRLRGLSTRLHRSIEQLEYYSALIPTPPVKRSISIHKRNLRQIARELLALSFRKELK